MKSQIIPLNKEEMDRLLEISMENGFFYMLFMVAKTTGRRLGELYGVEDKTVIKRKVVGKKRVYDKDGNRIIIDRTIPVYKKTNKFSYGVQLKDINFEKRTMKVWVLKRRQMQQDETILTSEVVRLIREYANRWKLKPEDYVFRHYHYRHIQNRVGHYGKLAGIKKKISFHNFRHYFITELLKQGWAYNEVVKLTGHKS
ncbi:MAG: tyrosine-type recombinase/integrase, partial [Atribacterota bacterium]